MTDLPYVFVSYAHADAAIIQPYLDALRTGGLEVWTDKRLQPGSVWSAELAVAIRGCATFCLFASRRSLASENCLNEAQFAFHCGSPAALVMLDGSALPDELQLTFARVQAVRHDHRDPPGALVSLLRRLQAGDVPAARSAPGETALAVLPLANLGRDQRDDHLCAGLATDLSTALHAAGLSVAGADAVAASAGRGTALAELAASLGAAHLLLGSLQRAGERLRVTMQLVRAANNTLEWSERFDVEPADVFSMQDAIATRVCDALAALLSADAQPRAAPTRDFEAFESYLKGGELARRIEWASLAAAEQHFAAAVARQPDYLDAWLAMADSILFRQQYLWNADELNRAADALDRARQIGAVGPDAAHLAALDADVHFQWSFRADAWERGLAAGLAEFPSDYRLLYRYGVHLRNVGLAHTAVACIERALQLQRGYGGVWAQLCLAHVCSGGFAAGVDAARTSLALQDNMPARIGLVAALSLTGANAECDAEIERFVAELGANHPLADPLRGYGMLFHGDVEGAGRLVGNDHPLLVWRGFTWLALGEFDVGMDALTASLERKEFLLKYASFLLVAFRGACGAARRDAFQGLLGRMGMADGQRPRYLERAEQTLQLTGLNVDSRDLHSPD